MYPKILGVILKSNTFEFNGEFYTQTCGCTMGSPASPEIAYITFYAVERKLLEIGGKPIHTWHSFSYEIFIVFTGTETELKQFIQCNNIHQTYKFAYEYSSTNVTYLDLDIFKGDRFSESNILDMT